MFFGGNYVKNVLDFDDIHIIFSMNKRNQRMYTIHSSILWYVKVSFLKDNFEKV